ncbi:glutathione binding-like protein [Bradyrhizobium yuanmingense]|nr:glutathione binding-like protein [Bradyrhizobium yuanmingense]MDF0497917.1 glutathione binding-like protein [Bradyrhizobium yuanmingense]
MAELRRRRDPQGVPVSDLLVQGRRLAGQAAREDLQTLSVPAAHLAGREFLVGNAFTVADAHLTWTLLLLRPAGIDIAQWPALAAYLERMQARPAVKEAISTEMALRKTVAASAA